MVIDVDRDKIISLLVDHEMGKGDLCIDAGVSPATISRLFRDGKTSIETAGKIARALKVSSAEILLSAKE